jgi:hypothetical protein
MHDRLRRWAGGVVPGCTGSGFGVAGWSLLGLLVVIVRPPFDCSIGGNKTTSRYTQRRLFLSCVETVPTRSPLVIRSAVERSRWVTEDQVRPG